MDPDARIVALLDQVIRGREASGSSQEQVLAISEPWLPVELESFDVEIRVDMSEGVPFAVRSFSELPPGAVYSSLWYDGRLESRASASIGSTTGSRLPADPGEYPLEAHIVVEDIDMYPIAADRPGSAHPPLTRSVSWKSPPVTQFRRQFAGASVLSPGNRHR